MSDTRHVILLHGALGAAAQLAPLAEALGSALGPSVNVHTPELEGHGMTPARGRPYRIRHFAENVRQFLDGRGIERAGMFGYSMGGYVGVHLLAEGWFCIDRLVTLGTKFRWDERTANQEAERLDVELMLKKVRRFADALAARHEAAGGWEAVVAGTADCLRDLGRTPLLDDAALARVKAPVRVMVGDRDRTVSVEESAAVSRVLPNADLAVLPNTEHPLEQVALHRLVPLLTEFLASPARAS